MPLPTSSPTSVPYTGASHHHNTRHSQVQQPMHAVSTYDQDEAEMRARELSDLNQALELHARQQAERDQVQNRLDGGTQADVEMSKGESGGGQSALLLGFECLIRLSQERWNDATRPRRPCTIYPSLPNPKPLFNLPPPLQLLVHADRRYALSDQFVPHCL